MSAEIVYSYGGTVVSAVRLQDNTHNVLFAKTILKLDNWIPAQITANYFLQLGKNLFLGENLGPTLGRKDTQEQIYQIHEIRPPFICIQDVFGVLVLIYCAYI